MENGMATLKLKPSDVWIDDDGTLCIDRAAVLAQGFDEDNMPDDVTIGPDPSGTLFKALQRAQDGGFVALVNRS